MTVRHRGGGAKRNYRRIDFRRDKLDVPARLATIEYDPNRSARIGLLHYADGEKRYILVPQGLQVGDTVVAGAEGRGTGRQRPAPARPSRWGRSSTTSSWCPARAARSCARPARPAQLMAKEGAYAAGAPALG